MRSGFPPWVRPAQPSFGRNPRGDFGTGEGCVPWHGLAIIGALRAVWLLAERRTWGALGRHGEGKAANVPIPGCSSSRTGLCHRGLCASACVPCGSHRPPRCPTWPPGPAAAPGAVTGHCSGRTRLEGWIWVGGRQRKVSGSHWGMLKRQRSLRYPRAGCYHHQHLAR